MPFLNAHRRIKTADAEEAYRNGMATLHSAYIVAKKIEIGT